MEGVREGRKEKKTHIYLYTFFQIFPPSSFPSLPSCFATVSSFVAQASFELLILLSSPPECGIDKHAHCAPSDLSLGS